MRQLQQLQWVKLQMRNFKIATHNFCGNIHTFTAHRKRTKWEREREREGEKSVITIQMNSQPTTRTTIKCLKWIRDTKIERKAKYLGWGNKSRGQRLCLSCTVLHSSTSSQSQTLMIVIYYSQNIQKLLHKWHSNVFSQFQSQTFPIPFSTHCQLFNCTTSSSSHYNHHHHHQHHHYLHWVWQAPKVFCFVFLTAFWKGMTTLTTSLWWTLKFI